ncbi:MAG: PEGA domain-containing protein [Planctomycetota bacterium]
MHSPRPRLTLLVVPVLLGSCIYPRGDSRVFVTSDPAGADILVDGEDSGQTTPGVLDLGGFLGGSHRLSILKKGFETEERTVSHYTRVIPSRMRDGVSEFSLPPFPLLFTFGDLFFPFEIRWVYVPHNLHVKLFPEGTFAPRPLPGQGSGGDEKD